MFFLLLGMCSANGFEGKNPQRLGPYLIVVGMVVATGVAASARIARGMRVRTDDQEDQHARGRRALHTLLYLIGVQVVLTAAVTCLDRPQPSREWGQFLLVYLASREAPYAALFCALLRKLTPRTLAFAVAVPGVLLFFNLPSLHWYVGHPVEAGESLITWAAHIVILAFAVRGIRRNDSPRRLGPGRRLRRVDFLLPGHLLGDALPHTAPCAEPVCRVCRSMVGKPSGKH